MVDFIHTQIESARYKRVKTEALKAKQNMLRTKRYERFCFCLFVASIYALVAFAGGGITLLIVPWPHQTSHQIGIAVFLSSILVVIFFSLLSWLLWRLASLNVRHAMDLIEIRESYNV